MTPATLQQLQYLEYAAEVVLRSRRDKHNKRRGGRMISADSRVAFGKWMCRERSASVDLTSHRMWSLQRGMKVLCYTCTLLGS